MDMTDSMRRIAENMRRHEDDWIIACLNKYLTIELVNDGLFHERRLFFNFYGHKLLIGKYFEYFENDTIKSSYVVL